MADAPHGGSGLKRRASCGDNYQGTCSARGNRDGRRTQEIAVHELVRAPLLDTASRRRCVRCPRCTGGSRIQRNRRSSSPERATHGSWGLHSTLSGQAVGTNEWLGSGVDLTFGTASWHRYRELPRLRRGDAHHRVYRGFGCDSGDPSLSEENTRNLRILPIDCPNSSFEWTILMRRLEIGSKATSQRAPGLATLKGDRLSKTLERVTG